MDPQAALDAARALIRQGKRASGNTALQHYGDAGERITAYWEWRGGGGFEPFGGDSRAGDLAAELSEAWEKEADAQDRDLATHADYFENPGAPPPTASAIVRERANNPGESVVFYATSAGVTVTVYKRGNGYDVSATVKDSPGGIGGTGLTKKQAREWTEDVTENAARNTGKLWKVYTNDIDATVPRSLRSRLNPERKENRGESGEFRYKGYLFDVGEFYDGEAWHWDADVIDVAPGARWYKGLYGYRTKGGLVEDLKARVNQELASKRASNPGTPITAAALVGRLKF